MENRALKQVSGAIWQQNGLSLSPEDFAVAIKEAFKKEFGKDKVTKAFCVYTAVIKISKKDTTSEFDQKVLEHSQKNRE